MAKAIAVTQLSVILVTFVFLLVQLNLKNLNEFPHREKRYHTETHTIWGKVGDEPKRNHPVQTLQVNYAPLKLQNEVGKDKSFERAHNLTWKQTRSTGQIRKSVKDSETKSRLDARRAHVIKICNNSSSHTKNRRSIKFRKYVPGRLEWCSIPKSGSTFLIRELLPTLDITGGESTGSTKRFVVVREPYSRLVSGFFSKLVGHPGWWPYVGAAVISKFRPQASLRNKQCGHDVTFQEFIRFVILSYEHRMPYRNNHFLPMSEVCNVCTGVPDYVVKLETINVDMEYILQSANVTGNTNIPFIEIKHLAELFMSYKSKFQHCAPMCDLLNRYWWGQQATGLIANDLELPVKGKACENVTGEKLAEIAWNAHQLSVGRITKREQKRKASMELWREVSLENRLKIRAILAQDCELFGYDLSPDLVFPKSDNIISQT